MAKSASPKTTLHLGKIRARNYRKLTLVDWTPAGNHLRVTGPNEAGKTSSLAIVFALLTGRTGKDPIKHGAAQSDLYGEIVDANGDLVWKITRTITASEERLDLCRADGSKVKLKPQGHLDVISLPLCFSPGEWARKPAAERLADVLRIGQVKPPVAEVEKLTGEPTPANEGESAASYLERLISPKFGSIFTHRTELNRQKIQKAKALESFPMPAEDDGEVECDLTSLIEERAALDAKREKRRESQKHVDAAAATYAEKSRKLETCRLDLGKVTAEIAELEKSLAAKKAAAADLEKLVALGEQKVPSFKTAVDNAKDALAAIEDPSPRIAEIDKEMADADRNRNELAERRQARETRHRLELESDQATEAYNRIDAVVAGVRTIQDNLLNKVELRVEGLTVRDGELFLDGVTFDQGSRVRQTEVGIDLAILENPDLKILLLDDAEKFDAAHEARILKRAESRGFQCALAVVDRDATEIDHTTIEAHYDKPADDAPLLKDSAGPYREGF